MQRLVVCVDGVLQLGNSINVLKLLNFLSSFCRECNAQINLSRRCNKELVEVATLNTHQMQSMELINPIIWQNYCSLNIGWSR